METTRSSLAIFLSFMMSALSVCPIHGWAVDDPFYPDYADVQALLQRIATNHSNIASYHDIGDEMHGMRKIVALKISDNVDTEEDEPTWIFNGVIHGSEQLGSRVLIDLATELATEYGNETDVTQWVDAYEIWIVLVVNAWGYEHDRSGGSSVTGTRRNGESTADANTSGVDLARNYDFRWDQAPANTTDPEDGQFRGPEAFSENETRAMRDLYSVHRPVFGITFHQGNDPDGGQIMRPWSTGTVSVPPDEDLLADYAENYADWVFASRSGGSFCDFTLQDPDGDGSCTNESDEEYCNELCWEPRDNSTLGAYGQPSNWYYAAVGAFHYTVEISDRMFNGLFMHTGSGPTTEDEETVKEIATEFSRNHQDAIKAWFDYFLHNTTEPFQFAGPGITGHITDALFGRPVSAQISVTGFTSSLIEDRISDPDFGRFWRFLPVDTYTVDVNKAGYQSWSGSVTVGGGALTQLDVELTPDMEIILPSEQFVAWVGEPENTRSFIARLRIGGAGDPCVGALPFDVFVRDEDDTWIRGTIGAQACVQDTYWLLAQAPDSDDGSFLADATYDLRVELDTVRAESAKAIRYSDRDQDTIIVMDVSGSMASGDKLEAAQEAAALLVNELTEDDQAALVWFSGDGVEPNRDADTDFELGPMSVANQITLLGKIAGLGTKDLTSIGDGLVEALDESQSARADANHHCSIVLLSDGMENEADFWTNVEVRARESSCALHVVALGPEADEPLLEEISQKGTPGTDDDGSYSYAAISDGFTAAVAPLAAWWPNLLAGKYDQIANHSAQRQRIFKQLGSVGTSPADHSMIVDPSIGEAVFAVKWTGDGAEGKLVLTRPDNTPVRPDDANVMVRSGSGSMVYRIREPQFGKWHAVVRNLKPNEVPDMSYILLGSAETFVELNLFTSADVTPVVQGEPVQVLAMLSGREGPVAAADVHVTITQPDGRISRLQLYDDGSHGDGEADDGFYANVFDGINRGDVVDPDLPEAKELGVVGSYILEAVARTNEFERIAETSFAATPSADADGDGLPTNWEVRHGLDPKDPSDAGLDPDQDGLSNIKEFLAGTDPNDSDTDDGGEADGSELYTARDPVWRNDDQIVGVADFAVSPLPKGAALTWAVDRSHAFYHLWRRQGGGKWKLISDQIEPTGSYEDKELVNGLTYEYKMTAFGSKKQYTGSTELRKVLPVADPFPPTGSVRINKGAKVASSRDIVLDFTASMDTVAMRYASKIDEGTDEIGGAWRHFSSHVDWRIPVEIGVGETFTVYVQYRDRTGNESKVFKDSIVFAPPPCEGDFDRDGDVDLRDWAIFNKDMGRSDCPIYEKR